MLRLREVRGRSGIRGFLCLRIIVVQMTWVSVRQRLLRGRLAATHLKEPDALSTPVVGEGEGYR